MDSLDSQLLRIALLRWFDILGTVLVVGTIASRQLVFIPTVKTIQNKIIRQSLTEIEFKTGDRFIKIGLFYLFFLQLVTLIQTDFGLLEGARLFLLLCMMCLSRIKLHGKNWILLGSGVFLCLTGSLSGHALRGRHLLVLTDWLHYTAVAIWAGGLLPLRRIARAGRDLIEPAELSSFLARLIEIFSAWAIVCVAAILMTGGFNAMIYLNWQNILEPTYGKVLIMKLFFVMLVLGVGGFSGFYLLPRFQETEDGDALKAVDLEKLFYKAITIETTLVFTIFIFAAILTQTPLP